MASVSHDWRETMEAAWRVSLAKPSVESFLSERMAVASGVKKFYGTAGRLITLSDGQTVGKPTFTTQWPYARPVTNKCTGAKR